MSRILLTGNQGFFGPRFENVHRPNHTILGVDKNEVDIVDQPAVQSLVEGFQPNIVIHAAAITATAFSDAYPDLTRQINVDGAVHVAKAAQSVGAKLIFFSTEQVFNGNTQPGPYSETDTPFPDTMYGTTKLEAEEKIRSIMKDVWILRFTWMFGLPEYHGIVNPNVVWDALQMLIYNTPKAISTREYRGLTWVYHMIDRILGVLDLPSDTYHIGSHNDLSRYEIFQHIFHEMGVANRMEELLIPDNEKYPDRPRDVRLNTDKLSALGIDFPSSVEAVRECLSVFSLLESSQ